jgi:DNA invertase Pin-like site-specific DNA recombinase
MTGVVRAITYARVSTGRQAESGLSLEDQAVRMRSEVARRGWTVTAEAVDAGRSGRTGKLRPALADALEALAAGDADALVVAKLDRLARSTIALARIMATSQTEGWSLVILDPDLDTSTAAGRLTATVLGAVAEYESELIAERARMTHRQRRTAGKRPGQSPLLPDAVRLEVATRRAQGATFAAIADDLNTRSVPTARGGRWHPSTVSHVCRSVALDAELVAA